MRPKLTLLLLLFLSFNLQSQEASFNWAKNMGSSQTDNGRAIKVTEEGDIYVAGFFRGTSDFDPSSEEFNLASNGDTDLFIQKLDADGNFLWVKQIGGSASDGALSLDIDLNGDLLLSGFFTGNVDFDPSSASFEMNAGSTYDVFTLKLNADGEFLWAGQIASTMITNSYEVIADDTGNSYTIGTFRGTADFDPSGTVVNETTAGGNDIFVQKLDIDGNLIWVKTIGGAAGDFPFGITIDNEGDIIVTGNFTSTVDFDPSAGVFNMTVMGTTNIFVWKLEENGDFVWAKQMGASGDDTGYSISHDIDNNLYVAGTFSALTDFDPGMGVFEITSYGQEDIFIEKLDVDGNFIWVKRMGNTGSDVSYSIELDDEGNIYSTGWFQGTVDFDPNADAYLIESGGFFDIYIQKLNNDGDFDWAGGIGSSEGNIGYSLALNGDTLHCTGVFNGTTDFDVSAGGTANLSTNGSGDIFVLKLSNCINNTVDTHVACDAFTWIDGNIYEESTTTPTFVLTNSAGCDSVVTLNLTINNSSTAIDVQEACAEFTWIDGNVYEESTTTPIFVLTNSAGCDSVVTLNLTINNSSTAIDVQEACAEFTWIDGNTYEESTTTPTFVLTNSEGCDSIVTLNLTINNSSTAIDVQEACAEFTWIDGNTYEESTTTPTFLLTNSVGCDSMVTLNLTIVSLDLSYTVAGAEITSNADAGADFKWLNCNTDYSVISGETGQSFTATTNGSYAIEIAEGDCIDTTACIAISTIGIAENIENEALLIYPNPTSNTVTIAHNGLFDLKIMTPGGASVFSALVQDQMEVTMQHLSDGIYFAVITTPDRTITQKVIKH